MRRLALIVAGMSVANACAVAPADDIWKGASLFGRTEAKKCVYKVGEPIVFLVTPDLPNGLPKGDFTVKWERTGDDGVKDAGTYPLTTNEWRYTTRLESPGFVRLDMHVVDTNGKRVCRFDRGWGDPVMFDGGAGAEIGKLTGPPEPEDFDAFWTARKERLAKLPIIADLKPITCETKGVKVYAVTVNCAGPRPVTGYVSIPDGKGEWPVEVSFMGYSKGGIQRPPKHSPADRIHFEVNAHGYELGREKEYYAEFYESIKSGGESYAFDMKQNASRDQAYFSGMSWRVMRALQYVKTLPQWNGRDLKVWGASQGGLQAAWAAGLDPDVSEVVLQVVWCCDMKGCLTRPGWYVRWTPALDYYDPVNHARRFSRTCPVRIAKAGLGDYVSPPRGLACLYNAIPGPKSITWIQGAEHGYTPHRKDNPEYTFKTEDLNGDGPFREPVK